MKIVVFDLDETLGYFSQFSIFWDSLTQYMHSVHQPEQLTQTDFSAVLDLYPEFLRPNILNILSFLKGKKRTNVCQKIMIYTNNNGAREWVRQIVNYFEQKVRYPKLIDQIIAAFRVNGQRVEMCRTTYNKTISDFVRCTKIPVDAEICFIDDVLHPAMANDNIYYINIRPYQYSLAFHEMLARFNSSAVGKRLVGNDDTFDDIMMEYIRSYHYRVQGKNPKEYEVDKVVGKSIINHLQTFFHGTPKNKTMKNRGHRRSRTLKNK
jgi:hypothetical protein